MRIYLGGTNRARLRKARQRAPSHVFGTTWTPSDQRLADVPFFVDNGAFTSSFDPDEWRALLDQLERYAYRPDFVVLPDVYNDAEGTMARHREWIDAVDSRGLRPAAVLQPGMDVQTQIRLYDELNVGVCFVGGANRWKRAVGDEIVTAAHKRDLGVHIGNPGVPGGLRWAQRIDADSVDTASIVGSEAYHHLDELDGLSTGAGIKGGRQAEIGGVSDD